MLGATILRGRAAPAVLGCGVHRSPGAPRRRLPWADGSRSPVVAWCSR